MVAGSLIGAEVVAGEWATGKSLGVKEAIAIPFLVIGFMFLDKLNGDLGKAMSTLAVVVVSLYWLPRIVKKVGL
jgi:hypothetical protein